MKTAAIVAIVAMAGASAVEPTLEDLYLLVFRDGDGR